MATSGLLEKVMKFRFALELRKGFATSGLLEEVMNFRCALELTKALPHQA